MPLKLNVGLSKKVGQPEYSSLGASCHVEVVLDQSLVFDDLDDFHERVNQVFAACRQAVQDELARQQVVAHVQDAAGQAKSTAPAASQSNGHNGHRASQKQLDYAQQLAGQIRGLGIRRLESLATRMFNKPLAELSSLDASGLIDVLKDIKAGRIDLAAALSEAAA
jgi:hypothetical protein